MNEPDDEISTAVTIRPITAADIPGYHSCLDAVARERCYLAFLEAPPIGRSERFVRDQMAQGAPMLVAEAEGRIVGWCDVCRLSLPGFTHRGSLGMGVHPDFRRRGIGRRLIDAAIVLAREAGIERLELEVFASNSKAIALYESVGFAVEGTIRCGRKLDGKCEDVLAMGLFL